jgi:hypothetical protein
MTRVKTYLARKPGAVVAFALGIVDLPFRRRLASARTSELIGIGCPQTTIFVNGILNVMLLAERIRKIFVTSFRRRPRLFVLAYMFFGFLCAFGAGVAFMIRDNLRYGDLWLVEAGGSVCIFGHPLSGHRISLKQSNRARILVFPMRSHSAQ